MAKISDAWSWYHNRDLNRMALNFFLLMSVVIFIICRKGVRRTKHNTPGGLPPGPRGLPVLGYLPFLQPDLHCWFADLAQTFGPVMMMHIGSRKCIIVSSPEAAREVLRDHDTTFANHDVTVAGRIISFGGQNIVLQPYGPKWRTLRKASVRELLNTKTLDSIYALRQREVRRMVELLHQRTGEVVDVGKVVFVTALNVITAMLWGNSLAAEEWELVGDEFRDLINGIVHLFGVTNMSDIFPVLERMDLQGVQQKMKEHKEKLENFLSLIIEQREQTVTASGDQEKTKDFLQVMLELVKEDPHELLTIDNIKGILLDLITGGTDTTSTTVEWVLAEMMNKPETIRKTQKELESVVGKEEMVDESHLPKLHYLEALVKESLRLHPPIPLLIPRCPTATCTIGGYIIPKGSKIFINAWAIHRNPTIWENPSEFRPERFLAGMNKLDYYGSSNFNFIPFGSGRRICAGIPLAEKLNMHILATMLHSFEWRLPHNTKLDLVEKFGIVLHCDLFILVHRSNHHNAISPQEFPWFLYALYPFILSLTDYHQWETIHQTIQPTSINAFSCSSLSQSSNAPNHSQYAQASSFFSIPLHQQSLKPSIPTSLHHHSNKLSPKPSSMYPHEAPLQVSTSPPTTHKPPPPYPHCKTPSQAHETLKNVEPVPSQPSPPKTP